MRATTARLIAAGEGGCIPSTRERRESGAASTPPAGQEDTSPQDGEGYSASFTGDVQLKDGVVVRLTRKETEKPSPDQDSAIPIPP